MQALLRALGVSQRLVAHSAPEDGPQVVQLRGPVPKVAGASGGGLLHKAWQTCGCWKRQQRMLCEILKRELEVGAEALAVVLLSVVGGAVL